MKRLIKWISDLFDTKSPVEKKLRDYQSEWKEKEESLTRIIVDMTNDYSTEMGRLNKIIQDRDQRIEELENMNAQLEQALKFKT